MPNPQTAAIIRKLRESLQRSNITADRIQGQGVSSSAADRVLSGDDDYAEAVLANLVKMGGLAGLELTWMPRR